MFSIGDRVVYGSSGVCTIMDIGVPDMQGASYECYFLKPHHMPTSKIYAPVGNNTVAMRPLLSAAQAELLIDALPQIEGFTEHKDKQEAYNVYRRAIKSADSMQLAKLVKTLHDKKEKAALQRKTLASSEKEMYDMAETLLHGEIAEALHIPLEQVQEYISTRLQRQQNDAALA